MSKGDKKGGEGDENASQKGILYNIAKSVKVNKLTVTAKERTLRWITTPIDHARLVG